MAVEDIRTELGEVVKEYKLIGTILRGSVHRLRVLKHVSGRLESGARSIRPASVDRAAAEMAQEAFRAGEPIGMGAFLLRSVIDPDETDNTNAQSACTFATNAERFMDGTATGDGFKMPEVLSTVARYATEIHEHTDAILGRIEAMNGRMGALQQALGEVASGPVATAERSVLAYRNQL